MVDQVGQTWDKQDAAPSVDDDLDTPAHSGPVGQLTQHVSGEDGPTVGWEFNLGGGRYVWGGEISEALFEDFDRDQKDAMTGYFGFFIILYEPEPRVIGKAVDEYEARALVEFVGRAMMAGAVYPSA